MAADSDEDVRRAPTWPEVKIEIDVADTVFLGGHSHGQRWTEDTATGAEGHGPHGAARGQRRRFEETPVKPEHPASAGEQREDVGSSTCAKDKAALAEVEWKDAGTAADTDRATPAVPMLSGSVHQTKQVGDEWKDAGTAADTDRATPAVPMLSGSVHQMKQVGDEWKDAGTATDTDRATPVVPMLSGSVHQMKQVGDEWKDAGTAADTDRATPAVPMLSGSVHQTKQVGDEWKDAGTAADTDRATPAVPMLSGSVHQTKQVGVQTCRHTGAGEDVQPLGESVTYDDDSLHPASQRPGLGIQPPRRRRQQMQQQAETTNADGPQSPPAADVEKGKVKPETRNVFTSTTRSLQKRERKAALRCGECLKAFWYPSALKRHAVMHTGEKPYECDQCLSGFGYASSLRQHKESVHSGDRPRSSEVCPALTPRDCREPPPPPPRFSAAGSVRAESSCDAMGSSVDGEEGSAANAQLSDASGQGAARPESSCDAMGSSVDGEEGSAANAQLSATSGQGGARARADGLSPHPVSLRPSAGKAFSPEDGGGAQLIQCDICSAVFPRSQQKDHTSQHSVTFRCRRCWKMFVRVEDWARHAAMHGSAQSYKCGHCSLHLAFPASLVTHVRRVHGHLPTTHMKRVQDHRRRRHGGLVVKASAS